MKISQWLSLLVISCVAAVSTVYVVAKKDGNDAAPARESAYDRILRTGVIHCGYADWPPYILTKDAKTGKLQGISYDIMEAVAERLGLKAEWSENVGWGTFIESLRSQRIDAFCVLSGRSAERGRYLGYAMPVMYSAIYPYVRIDEHRFDNDLSGINSPDIRIATMDGEGSDLIARKFFPKATTVSIPGISPLSDVLLNVAMRKADVVFNEPSFVEGYIAANPGTLRRAQDKPFQVVEVSFAVNLPEKQLRDMLDSTLSELHNQGVIEQIISKYNSDPKIFLRIAQPYK